MRALSFISLKHHEKSPYSSRMEEKMQKKK